MEDTQSENPDVLTRSGSVWSEIENVECSISHQNFETDIASPTLEITRLIGSLYDAAVEGKVDAFKEHEKHLDQLLTPNKNTILHIHITARQLYFVEGIPKLVLEPDTPLLAHTNMTALPKKKSPLVFVEEILIMCPDLLWQINIKGETLLHIAARHGHDDIVELLMRKIRETHHNDQEKGVGPAAVGLMLKMTNKAKDTALHEAVRFNHIDVVRRLIKEGGDYSYGANDAGETPLYLAAERGYHDIVKIMASFTATPLAYDGPIGRTALHAAVIRNHLGMAEIILKKESTLTREKDEREWVPLHYAAHYGYIRIMRLLLKYDESAAYIMDKERKTALHIAARLGKVDIMKELISRCPDCSELVDARGWNVIHFAMESKNFKAISFILAIPSLRNLINEYNHDGNTPIQQLATSGFNWLSFIFHPRIDKLAFNKQNLNAIDITSRNYMFSSEQKYLMRRLEDNGIRKGLRVEINKDEGNREGVGPSSYDGKGKSDDGNIMAIFKEAKQIHMLVATLIATVTFAAGIAVPGGYKNDQGTATLLRNEAFKTFVITNTIAMMLSSSAVFFHLFTALGFDKELFLIKFDSVLAATSYAMLAMVIAFISGTYAILAPSGLAIATCVTGCILFMFNKLLLDPYILLYYHEKFTIMFVRMLNRIG